MNPAPVHPAKPPVRLALAIALAASCLLPDRALAGGRTQHPAEDPALEDGRGTALRSADRIIGVFASYGVGQRINGSAPIDITTFGLRWSKLGNYRSDGVLRGRSAFAIELMPAMTFSQSPRPYAAGFNLLFEHHFAGEEVFPFLRVGAGALTGTQKVPPTETRYNFSLLAAIGLDLPMEGERMLSLEYRFHHVSNGDSGLGNPGINAHTLVGGFSWFRK